MKSLEEILAEFNLSNDDIIRLSNEAKENSIGCGRKDNEKSLTKETWSIFWDISDKVWHSSATSKQKIERGFLLFDLFPDYYNFLVPFYHLIRNSEIKDESEKQIIWKKFMAYLSAEPYYADAVGYVLWVDFFEDSTTVVETWQGLMNHIVDHKALLKLLEHSGPVPYELKEPVFINLLPDKENHQTIFKSILYSAFDVFGQLDKDRAFGLVLQLEVDKNSYEFEQLILRLHSTENDQV